MPQSDLPTAIGLALALPGPPFIAYRGPRGMDGSHSLRTTPPSAGQGAKEHEVSRRAERRSLDSATCRRRSECHRPRKLARQQRDLCETVRLRRTRKCVASSRKTGSGAAKSCVRRRLKRRSRHCDLLVKRAAGPPGGRQRQDRTSDEDAAASGRERGAVTSAFDLIKPVLG